MWQCSVTLSFCHDLICWNCIFVDVAYIRKKKLEVPDDSEAELLKSYKHVMRGVPQPGMKSCNHIITSNDM